MDNSWDYNEGLSEIRLGKALRDGYRDKVFLITKIDGRTRKAAARQLEESLRRLQTGCIDLVCPISTGLMIGNAFWDGLREPHEPNSNQSGFKNSYEMRAFRWQPAEALRDHTPANYTARLERVG